jgi:D-alanine-D-alanine ligase
MKMRIAILTGGTSSEREIALASAEGVENALAGRFDIVVYDLPDDLDEFLLQYRSAAAVIPVFHGRGGEDGAIQGFLRTLNVPFLFSDIEAQALAANKYLAKNLIEKQGIATPKAAVVSSGDKINFKSPVVVKPLDGGSSIGVAIVKDEKYLAKALKEAFARSPKVLIEDYVEGDEYTVAVIDGEKGHTALPVVAIAPKTEFFDVKSKYDPSLVEEICPATVSAELANVLKDAAIKAHDVIGARHISRSDFIVDKNGKIWFLEINTIPGFTANSLVPKALKAAGIDFGELIGSWIRAL